MARTAGHGHEPGYKRGCVACQRNSRDDKRALRARNRGLEPYDPEPPDLTLIAGPAQPDRATERVFGPVEAAVQAEMGALRISVGSNALAAAALQMGRILDDRRLATTHPSAARQLERFIVGLKKDAAPKRGRLASVQDMSKRG